MNIYGRGIEDIDGGEDLYFVEEKTEAKQGGFQPRIDFKNKFSWTPFSAHFKASPKVMSIGTQAGYGITENGELLAWSTEEDKQGVEKNFNIDLKTISYEQRDGIIGKTANLLSFGKDRQETKKLTFTNIYSNNRGDFCIFTTMEGDNFLFIQRTRTIEYLGKLKRIINALKFLDVQNEDDKTVIKFICSSATGQFSHVVLEIRYKIKDKAMTVNTFDLAATEISTSKTNSLISKIDVGSA